MKLVRFWAGAAAVMLLALPALAQSRGTASNEAMHYLAYPEVQKELKLTPAQTKKVEDARKDSQARMLQTIRGAAKMTPEERRKRFGELRDQEDRMLVEMLDVKQRERLRQIEVQQMGNHALLRNDVAAELGLSETQRNNLQTLSVEENDETRKLLIGLGSNANSTAAENEAARVKMERVRNRTGEKMVAVLTTAQKKQFQALQGPPFHLSLAPATATSALSK